MDILQGQAEVARKRKKSTIRVPPLSQESHILSRGSAYASHF